MSDIKTTNNGQTATAPGSEEDFKLRVEGFQGTPEEIERQWFEQVYQGRGDSMAQLTWRAVLMGSVLGGVLSLTNLYIGLKSGWGFGVAVTACILSYAIWTSLHGMGIAKTKMTILENNCMQSTASAAGYSTGTTLVSAFSAYILINGTPLPLGLTFAWVFFLAVLGVTMAIPMKRQMINVEQLRFPTGVAAAETLKALHSHGDKGMRAAKALGLAGLLAGLDKLWADGPAVLDKYLSKWTQHASNLADWSSTALLDKLQALLIGPAAFQTWSGRTAVFSWDAIFVAAGAITGIRVCISMLVSGTLCWAVFVPWVQSTTLPDSFTSSGFKDVPAQVTFASRLKAAEDPVSQYIWSGLPASARQALENFDPAVPASSILLVTEMDGVLHDPRLYSPERFANVSLSPTTAALLAHNPQGPERTRLNRMLLQDAYPRQIVPSSSFRGLLPWSLWGGVACMVSSGLLNFLFQFKTSLRAFRSLGKMFKRGETRQDPLAAIEAPTKWFLIGQVVSLVVLAYLAKKTFGMPYWLAALALVLSFVLALVACRVTGETDTTPVGPMGQLTQMIVGAIHPGSATTTLMSANVVSSAAISSADLLTDLKSGYLLGANPRQQFLAQFSGIFIGTLVTVLAFSIIVPNASVLGTNQFPAPAAQSWRAVALTMSQGLAQLHPIKRTAIGVGAIVGVVLAVLPVLFPKKQKYLPSAAGVGLAWTFHWYYSLLFFLGAFIAWIWQKKWPKNAEEFTYPVASGVIAGGSLVGVFLIFIENGPEMVKKFFGH